jgi:hypothetical protein
VSILTQSRNAAIIIDVSVVPNTHLNLKHRGKWFVPMRQFVDPTWSQLEL